MFLYGRRRGKKYEPMAVVSKTDKLYKTSYALHFSCPGRGTAANVLSYNMARYYK
jgi:hypothetical protein